MATTPKTVKDALDTSTLWTFARALGLGLDEQYQEKIERKFNKTDVRMFTLLAHWTIKDQIKMKRAGTEHLQSLPADVVGSPVALAFVLREPKYLDFAKSGRLSYIDIIRVCGSLTKT